LPKSCQKSCQKNGKIKKNCKNSKFLKRVGGGEGGEEEGDL
jgi:hypothetical protein